MGRDPDKQRQPRQNRPLAKAQKSGGSWLRQAPQWPVYEVLLSKEWDDPERVLAQVLIARQSPRSGKIAAAAFLVDLGCLGVKSCFLRLCKSPDDYIRRVRESVTESEEFIAVDLNMAAKIITAGLRYAEQFGFAPDPELQQAGRLLEGADPAACETPVPLGRDGKPYFIAGPRDDVDLIIRKLTAAVGADGFHYLVMLPPDEAP